MTGGAAGIGRSICLALAGNCDETVAIDTDREGLISLQREISSRGAKANFFVGDLSKLSNHGNLFDESEISRADRVILVNNVGIRSKKDVFEESKEEWDTALNINLTMPFLLSRELGRQAIKHDFNLRVINILSVVSGKFSSQSPSYHVSKGGLEALTRYLAVALNRKGVRANVYGVAPGLIVQERHLEHWNSIGNSKRREIGKFYQPGQEVGGERDVAEVVKWLGLYAPNYLNGTVIEIDGGATLQDEFWLLEAWTEEN